MRFSTLTAVVLTVFAGACTTELLHGIGEQHAPLYQDANGDACVPEGPLTLSAPPPSAGFGLKDCFKIEGGEIGTNVSGALGEVTFTFSDWIAKEDSPGEWVGFTLTASSPVSYVVKTGGELHSDSATSWVHPNGTSGPEAPAISFVAVCLEEPELDRPEPDQPTEEPRCDANGCCRADEPPRLPRDPGCSHLDDECGYGAIEPDTGVCVYQENGLCDPSSEDPSGDDSSDPAPPIDDPEDDSTGGEGDPTTPDCSHLDDACGYGAYEPDTGICEYQLSGACDPVE